MNKLKKAIGIWIFFGGVIFIIAGFAFGVNRFIWLSNTVTADGIIVRMEERRGDKGSVTYMPIYRYAELDGIECERESGWSSSPPRFNVGDEVPVLINADDSSDSMLDFWMDKWLMSVLFFGLGLFSAVFGYFFQKFHAKKTYLESTAD